MADYVSLADAVEDCARVIVDHGAVDDEPLAFGALRRHGYTSRFIAAVWDQIHDRAAELVEANRGQTVH